MFKRVVHAVFTDKLCLFIICFGSFGLVMWQLNNLAHWMISENFGISILIPWIGLMALIGHWMDRKGSF